MVELLFLPSAHAASPTWHGSRYNAETLEIEWQGKNIAEVLAMRLDEARAVFDSEPQIARALTALQDIGLGYLKLGQPATDCRAARRSASGWPPNCSAARRCMCWTSRPRACIRLMRQLQGLVDAGNTVAIVEHDMREVAQVDWVIDLGPGAGEEGGKIVAEGTPREVAKVKDSLTAPFLAAAL